jgi:4-carboxymuconolactone decarboxylase
LARIPKLTTREGLTAEQQAVFDSIEASRGGVRGPFPILLHRAEVAAGADRIGGYLRYQSSLAPVIRESAILVTARLMQCEVQWTAHRELAANEGMSATALNAIRDLTFDNLSGEVRDTVEFARSIIEDHHVPADLFERCQRRWNGAELVDLASLIGYYCFLAVVINAFDEVPPPRIDPPGQHL